MILTFRWRIRASWWIWGPIVHQIHHEAFFLQDLFAPGRTTALIVITALSAPPRSAARPPSPGHVGTALTRPPHPATQAEPLQAELQAGPLQAELQAGLLQATPGRALSWAGSAVPRARTARCWPR